MRYFGKITDDKDIVTKEFTKEFIEKGQYKDGVVTREKLAQDAKGTLLRNITTANPFTPENNGALCYDYSASAAWDIDTNVLATLPDGWTMTFLNASASGVFTFTFKNMDVMDFISGNWSNVASKSFVAQQFGDGLKFIKYSSQGIMVIGAGTVRSIRSGTSAPATSLDQNGDVYIQYT